MIEVPGFPGGGAASAATVSKDYVGISEAAEEEKAAWGEDEEGGGEKEEEEELELGLGLSLGTKIAAPVGGGGKASPLGRILTAKDFPSPGSRSSASSVSSSSATLTGRDGGGGDAGAKRAADSIASATSPPGQVAVGWPPIRSFRINTMVNQSRDNYSASDAATHKNNPNSGGKEGVSNKELEKNGGNAMTSRLVKVKMDGDPIGRKVDLNVHHSYETLTRALVVMFNKPTMTLSTANYGTNTSKLLGGSSEFAFTYEDKDGDWMLVGDVPWGMFLDSVKRLRIMRTSEESGLVPRRQPSKSVGLIRNKPT